MVVRIRLARWGTRHEPFYGVVVANAKRARDGKHLERIGTYNSVPDQNGIKKVAIDFERVKYWLGVGAQPSDRVAWLLSKANILPTKPIQLQRIGQMSLKDRSTWDVIFTDANGNEKRVDPSEAESLKAQLDPISRALLERKQKGLKIWESPITPANVTLSGKEPVMPCTEREALRVLKAVLRF